MPKIKNTYYLLFSDLYCGSKVINKNDWRSKSFKINMFFPLDLNDIKKSSELIVEKILKLKIFQ